MSNNNTKSDGGQSGQGRKLHIPYVPATENPREITVTSILLGILLAVVFGAANAYLGLRVGLTVSASIPAAVVSMCLLRMVLRRDSVLENNIVQTIGSAGESLAAGAIFTMPALFMWASEGKTALPGFLPVTVLALAGGVLGVLFMVPLRRPLIVDEHDKLIYPEGTACADVLLAGEEGGSGAKGILAGLGVAAALKMVTDWFKWIPSAVSIPVKTVRGELGLDVSPALLGVGYIVGPRIATLVFAGSFFGWMVLIPCFAFWGDADLYARAGATGIWKEYVRFIGAGAIAAGGFFSLFRSMPVFFRSLRQKRGGTSVGGDAALRTGRDLPLKRVLIGIVCVIAILAALPAAPVGIGGALLIALFGFMFAAVSARMVGFVGSSNNPISGMTIATVIVCAFVLKSTGTVGSAGLTATIAIASVVCITAAIAGDTAQDLKTGFLLGATPWKQQLGELAGVAASSLAICGVLYLLHAAWGFGSDSIPAPQATLMKMLTDGVMGGQLPWELLAVGAMLAVVLEMLKVPVMPFAIGLYLPIRLNATIMLGGLLRVAFQRWQKTREDGFTLVSAGLIAGEGIAGIALAIITLCCKR